MKNFLAFLRKYQEQAISATIVVLGVVVLFVFFRSRPVPQPEVSSTTFPEVAQVEASPSASPAAKVAVVKAQKRVAAIKKPTTTKKSVSIKRPGETASAVKRLATKPTRVTRPIKIAKKTPVVRKVAQATRTRYSYSPYHQSYVVRKGDSLWRISVRHSGKRANWHTVYNLNRVTVGSNPHRIYPRQKLVLPKNR